MFYFSIWVNNRLHFGTDRLFFVEHELGNANAKPHQLLKAPTQPNMKKKLKFYFDFSSPWTYLGYKQVNYFFLLFHAIIIMIIYYYHNYHNIIISF